MSKAFQMLYYNSGLNFRKQSLLLDVHDGQEVEVKFSLDLGCDESMIGKSIIVSSSDCPQTINLPITNADSIIITISNPLALKGLSTTGRTGRLALSMGDLNALQNIENLAIRTFEAVGGSFNDLQLPKLQKFEFSVISNIPKDYPNGDLSVFGDMLDLKSLKLHMRYSNLNAVPLNKLTGLTTLHLNGNFTCDEDLLNGFRSLQSLTMCDWKNPIDFSKLDLPELKSLTIDCMRIVNKEAISKFLYLQELNVFSQRTTDRFNLNWFTPLTLLGHLYMMNSAEGTLSSISNLCGLKELVLAGKEIYGELCDLRHYQLKMLCLGITRVRGLLQELEPHSETLEHLDLHKSAISGKLAELRRFAKLRYLDLSQTTVSGSLDDIQTLRNLETLKLSNTGIRGNLSSVTGFDKLEVLNLNDSYVGCGIHLLHSVPNLKKLYLSNTDVHGHVEGLVNKNIPSLERFDYHHSRMSGSWKSVVPEVNDEGMIPIEDYNLMKQHYESKIANLKKQLEELKAPTDKE